MKRLLCIVLFSYMPLQARIWKYPDNMVRFLINDIEPIPSQYMTSSGIPNFNQIPFAHNIVGATSETPYQLRHKESRYKFFSVDSAQDAQQLSQMNRYPVQWYYYRYGQDNPIMRSAPSEEVYPYPMLPEEISKTQSK